MLTPELLIAVGEITTIGRPDYEAAKDEMRQFFGAAFASLRIQHYLNYLRDCEEHRVRLNRAIHESLQSMPPETAENMRALVEIRAQVRFLSGEVDLQFHLISIAASQIARLIPHLVAPVGYSIPESDMGRLTAFKNLRDNYEHLNERLPGGKRAGWMVVEDETTGQWTIEMGYAFDRQGRILLNGATIDVTGKDIAEIQRVVTETWSQVRLAALQDLRDYLLKHPDRIPPQVNTPEFLRIEGGPTGQ
jgi:hypothetical protein